MLACLHHFQLTSAHRGQHPTPPRSGEGRLVVNQFSSTAGPGIGYLSQSGGSWLKKPISSWESPVCAHSWIASRLWFGLLLVSWLYIISIFFLISYEFHCSSCILTLLFVFISCLLRKKSLHWEKSTHGIWTGGLRYTKTLCWNESCFSHMSSLSLFFFIVTWYHLWTDESFLSIRFNMITLEETAAERNSY